MKCADKIILVDNHNVNHDSKMVLCEIRVCSASQPDNEEEWFLLKISSRWPPGDACIDEFTTSCHKWGDSWGINASWPLLKKEDKSSKHEKPMMKIQVIKGTGLEDTCRGSDNFTWWNRPVHMIHTLLCCEIIRTTHVICASVSLKLKLLEQSRVNNRINSWCHLLAKTSVKCTCRYETILGNVVWTVAQLPNCTSTQFRSTERLSAYYTWSANKISMH